VPHNAPIFGLDLSAIDKIVLSHGHYDHTGGLKEVLKHVGKQVEVIAHPDIWAQKYARGQGFERYIGVPFPIEDLEDLGGSFTMIYTSKRTATGATTTCWTTVRLSSRPMRGW